MFVKLSPQGYEKQLIVKNIKKALFKITNIYVFFTCNFILFIHFKSVLPFVVFEVKLANK